MKFYDKAQGYFDSHPATDEFHFTSDGLAFFLETDAEAHARNLTDKEIETITREDKKPDESEVEEKVPATVTVKIDKLVDGLNIEGVASESVQSKVSELVTDALIKAAGLADTDTQKVAENAQLPLEAPKKAAPKKATTKK